VWQGLTKSVLVLALALVLVLVLMLMLQGYWLQCSLRKQRA